MPVRVYKRKKKVYRKKRTVAKRRMPRTSGILQRGLRPAVHVFKRQMPHQVVKLDEAIPGTGWDTTYAAQGYIAKLWQFKLSDFNNTGDFTNLFSYYKLNAVSLKIYQATSSVPATRNNSQCILTIIPARTSDFNLRTPSGLECIQARKDRLLLNTTGKPHKVYMRLNQLGMRYGSPTGVPPSVTDYVMRRPSYCSTQEESIEHYGIWTYIRAVNGSAFDNIQLRIEPTIYLTCKQCE